MDLTRNDILKYFDEINNYLAERGKHGEIIIAGGAALTLVYEARDSTRDIDAVFIPKEDLRAAIKAVGEKNYLDDDWLNDGVKGFFTDKMTASVYKQYSNLIVRSIDPECLLAMKLTSARIDTNDMSDSITLMKHLIIKNIDELYEIIQNYAHPNQLTARANFFTIQAFENYTKELKKSPKKSFDDKLREAKEKVAEQNKKSSKNKDTTKSKNGESLE